MNQPSMLRDPATILGIAVVSTAVGMAFGYVRRGMIAEVQRHETQPHSEEWYEEVMGGTVLRSCGESVGSGDRDGRSGSFAARAADLGELTSGSQTGSAATGTGSASFNNNNKDQ